MEYLSQLTETFAIIVAALSFFLLPLCLLLAALNFVHAFAMKRQRNRHANIQSQAERYEFPAKKNPDIVVIVIKGDSNERYHF